MIAITIKINFGRQKVQNTHHLGATPTCIHTYTHLVWSELINEVVHVNEEHSEILNLLISLCVY